MSKLIFNPKKDMKELLDYRFKYDDNKGQYKFCERNIDGATYIYVNIWNGRVTFRQDKGSDTQCLTVLYKLIKANLFIDEEELNEINGATNN